MNMPNRPFSSLAGYFIDAWRLCRAQPINLHSYAKFLALRRLKERTGAQCFIETGTYRGVTTARCAPLFSKIVTIELDETLARNAAEALAAFRHIEVIQGDAVQHLDRILARDEMSQVEVFLDGHFSGGITARGDIPEPAILELELLNQHVTKIAGIIIDDFRLFGTEPGFPTKAQLVSAVESLFPYPSFVTTVHADQVIIARHESTARLLPKTAS